MDHLGYIHNILDVKVLILYVMSLVQTPVSAQTIYELCYQDDSLSYFDVQMSVPQMVESGHLEQEGEDLYVITEKGRDAGEVTWDGIAVAVRERAKIAVEQYNKKQKRDQYLRSSLERLENGEYLVHMGLDDMNGPVMNLSITAPSEHQACRLEKAYLERAEDVHRAVMSVLLGKAKSTDTEN